MSTPRISFGIIVLNGEPFTRYNLRALYPYAHQIIVVEGASPNAARSASSDGHSLDGTLEILRRFQAEEDPEGKLTVVTAEDEGHPSGFWPGEKDEQSRAYARRATGDWLWQVDIDEFYQPRDMQRIRESVMRRRDVQTVSFHQIQFWGSLEYYVDGWYLRHYGGGEFHRLFRWGSGYHYATHRPPTILDAEGRDLRSLGWVRGNTGARQGIHLYHYSLVFPDQVIAKSDYYKNLERHTYGQMDTWQEQNYQHLKNPFRVHNVYQFPSWLERYTGQHPPQVLALWEDIRKGRVGQGLQLRRTDDIAQLLDSPTYQLGRLWRKQVGPLISGTSLTAIRAFRALPAPLRSRLRSVKGRA